MHNSGRTAWLVFIACCGFLHQAAWGTILPVIHQVDIVFQPFKPNVIDEATIRRVAGIMPGDSFSPARLSAAVKDLYQIGVFRQVETRVYTHSTGVNLTFLITPLPRLQSLKRKGMTAFRGREAIELTGLMADTMITDHQVALIPDKFVQAYKDRGYWDAKVTIQRHPIDDAEIIEISADQGQQYRIETVDKEVLEGVWIPAADKILQAYRGKPYTRRLMDRIKREIHQLYEQNGYIAQSVEYTVMPGSATHTLMPIILVSSGPQLDLKIQGIHLSTSEIRQELGFFRLSDTSPFIQVQSRNDLIALLRRKGIIADDIRETRHESDDGRKVSVLFDVKGIHTEKQRPIHLKGNRTFSDESLTIGSNLPEAVYSFPGESLQWLGERVCEYYRKEGFPDVIVSVDATTTRAIQLLITEGTRVRLGTVHVETSPPIGLDIASTREMLEGHWYTSDVEDQLRTGASDSAAALGYGVEQLVLKTQREKNVVNVSIRLSLVGPERLGKVVRLGRLRTRPSVLSRLIPLKDDTPLDTSAISRTESQLYSAGMFDSVTISTYNASGIPDAHNVVVQLREAPRFTFGYGFGYQTWERLRGLLEWTDGNLLGTGKTLSILGRVSVKKQSLQMTLHGERLLLWKQPSDISIYADNQERPSFKSARISFFAQQLFQLHPTLTLLTRLSFEKIYNYDISQSSTHENRRDQPITLPALSGTLIHDTRDNLMDPRTGTMLSADSMLAPRAFGAGTGFFRLTLQAQHFRRLVGSLSTAVSLRIGTIQTILGSGEIPISERYFAGGPSSLRGIRVDRAGPLDPKPPHDPIGGNALIIANTEVRFPLLRATMVGPLEGACFYDGGNALASFHTLGWSDITHTVGTGIRLRTPMGPLRLDFAYTLKPVPFEPRRYQIVFTVGNPF